MLIKVLIIYNQYFIVKTTNYAISVFGAVKNKLNQPSINLRHNILRKYNLFCALTKLNKK